MQRWWRYSLAVYFGLMIAGALSAQDPQVFEVMHIGGHELYPLFDGPQAHHEAVPSVVAFPTLEETEAPIMASAVMTVAP